MRTFGAPENDQETQKTKIRLKIWLQIHFKITFHTVHITSIL